MEGEFDDLQARLASVARLSQPLVESGDVTEYQLVMTPEQAAVPGGGDRAVVGAGPERGHRGAGPAPGGAAAGGGAGRGVPPLVRVWTRTGQGADGCRG